MNVEFITTCISRSPLLTHYENSKTRPAGQRTKQAIISSGYFNRFDLFEDYAVTTEILRYQKEAYAVVTHSLINHFFKIHKP